MEIKKADLKKAMNTYFDSNAFRDQYIGMYLCQYFGISDAEIATCNPILAAKKFEEKYVID